EFVRKVMPHYASKIRLYKDSVPLFNRYQIESQIETAYQREVKLPSGGSIVIDPTEALVSIDINSSRSTKGSDIEETALNTNLEAAEEIARQLRLRDIGGLIVIDFIDMTPPKHQRMVEDKLRDSLAMDRARIQIGRISRFGLLELSRQRLRPSLEETTGLVCPRCNGTGVIRDVRSLGLSIMRIIEEEVLKDRSAEIRAQVPVSVAAFLLNEKRVALATLESRSGVRVVILPNPHLETPHYEVTRFRDDQIEEGAEPPASFQLVEAFQPTHEDNGLNRREERAPARRQEAAVKMAQPETQAPAPKSREDRNPAPAARAAEPAPEAAAEAENAAGPRKGFFAWFANLFNNGQTVQEEVESKLQPVAEAPAPVSAETAAPQQPRQPRERNGRNRGDRYRGERGDRGERQGGGDQPRGERNERPQRAERPERQERPERIERQPDTVIDAPVIAAEGSETVAQPGNNNRRERQPREGREGGRDRRERQPRPPRPEFATEAPVTDAVAVEDAPVTDNTASANGEDSAAPQQRRPRRDRFGNRRNNRGPRERDPRVLVEAGLMTADGENVADTVEALEMTPVQATVTESAIPVAAINPIVADLIAAEAAAEQATEAAAPEQVVAEAAPAPVVEAETPAPDTAVEAPAVEAEAAPAPAPRRSRNSVTRMAEAPAEAAPAAVAAPAADEASPEEAPRRAANDPRERRRREREAAEAAVKAEAERIAREAEEAARRAEEALRPAPVAVVAEPAVTEAPATAPVTASWHTVGEYIAAFLPGQPAPVTGAEVIAAFFAAQKAQAATSVTPAPVAVETVTALVVEAVAEEAVAEPAPAAEPAAEVEAATVVTESPLVIPACTVSDYVATWLPDQPKPESASDVISAFVAAMKKHAESKAATPE
ncbi:MAG TPA: ribonuclease E/G, partial [Fluviicoccus sp.]|nr:ribonuclease E/G [Fluviicoccus sp.]